MEWDSNAGSEWGLENEFSGVLDSSNKDGGGFSGLMEEGSVLSGEAMIGLKLGRQTGRQEKLRSDAFSSVLDSSYTPVKRSRDSQQSSLLARCQVEGCNLDLASAKEYHRRHRICADHSKSPKVVVAGMERRFCQQCSRLHDLSEFDDKKRSCRRRLSTHNARRRRPQSRDNKIGSTRTLRISTPQSSSNFNGGCVGMMSNGGLSDISSCFGGISPRKVDHDGLEANSSSINEMEGQHCFPLEPTSSWGFRGHKEPSSFDQFMHEHSIGLMQPGMPLEMPNTRNTQIPHDHFDCFCSD